MEYIHIRLCSLPLYEKGKKIWIGFLMELASSEWERKIKYSQEHKKKSLEIMITGHYFPLPECEEGSHVQHRQQLCFWLGEGEAVAQGLKSRYNQSLLGVSQV